MIMRLLGAIIGFLILGWGIFGFLVEAGVTSYGDTTGPVGFVVAFSLIFGGGTISYLCLKRMIKSRSDLSKTKLEKDERNRIDTPSTRIPGNFEKDRFLSKNLQENFIESPIKVFISYRRSDSANITGRIYDRLLLTFAKENIFRDVDTIPFGVDFRVYIDEMIKDCDACLVIIGSRWLDSGKSEGRRRIDEARDFVRIEIESALARDIPVIPVVVDEAQMPSPEELPSSIRALAFRNGVPVRPDPDFHHDMDRLIKGLIRKVK